MNAKKRKVIFENGRVFHGTGFGSFNEAICEVVFNTSMVGYQEIMSDPSYCDQIVCMTYPLIGNYGLTDEDYETKIPHLGGFLVREYNDYPSNYRYTRTLADVMSEYGIVGIQGVDTRQITRMIRNEGSMRAIIVDEERPDSSALEEMGNTPWIHNQVSKVSCKRLWYSRTSNYKYNIVAIDCGIKHNIIRQLNAKGCNVTVVPYTITADEVLDLRPDGLFLSNGPGDPTDVPSVINLVRELWGKLPIFGICLGHQIIALAAGGETYKMKFGHRGGNHPVKNLLTDKIEITSQNHSFAVNTESLKNTKLELTHINLLDHTAEGQCCHADRVFSVQYHPESAPGPQDSDYLFDRFIQYVEEYINERGEFNA